MLKLTVFALCVLACWALPIEEIIPILSQESESDGAGNYHFGFEAGNGIKVHEAGEMHGQGETAEEEVRGSYEYTDPNGKLVRREYTAGKEGFQVVGDDIPQMSPEIAESLKYNAAHPEEDDYKPDRH